MDNQLMRFDAGNGVRLHVLKTDKFKTVEMNLCVMNELGDDYSKNALLPYVMRRGNQKFETAREIEVYLEGLYGADFSYGILKRGERHIMSFGMGIADEKYISSGEDLISKGIGFLWDVFSMPTTENNVFKKEYVEQEKKNQIEKIKALVNDKTNYAVERCFQEMCKNEKYGRYVDGDIEEIKSIDEQMLYTYYNKVFDSSTVDLFVVGNVEPEIVLGISKDIIKSKERHQLEQMISDEIVKETGQEKLVIEELDVNQGKLSLGFRTDITAADSDYFDLMVYNSVLGGGPHSKLFQNVREKESLAYYVFSRIEKFKGLMIISSGIETDSYEKALEIIKQQVEDIRQGRVDIKEMDSAKKAIINSYKSLNDSAYKLIDYDYSNFIKGVDITIEEAIEKVQKVEINDIIKVAEKIKLDTIYFLTNNRKGM